MEGAVAAAVAAGLGDPLEAVAAAARGGLAAKAAHLAPERRRGDGAGGRTSAGRARRRRPRRAPGAGRAETTRVTVRNALGLHARPAALLVRTAAGFDAARHRRRRDQRPRARRARAA